jgi:hypothetical protein
MFFGFACFVFLSGAAYISLGRPVNGDEFAKFVGNNLEILGLLFLHHKIRVKKSVAGISGTTVMMYAFVYAQRIMLSLPSSQDEWKDLDFDITFGSVSLLLVLGIVKSVWFRHRDTYESELDLLKAQYIIPGCYLAALLVRPDFTHWDAAFSYWWSSCMYMDMLALLPQVVMMAQRSGKVQSPIAHFVAGTFLCRIDDLWDSFGRTNFQKDSPTSYWSIIGMQTFHLLLVADFMYYWTKAHVKARGRKCALMQEVDLLADYINV